MKYFALFHLKVGRIEKYDDIVKFVGFSDYKKTFTNIISLTFGNFWYKYENFTLRRRNELQWVCVTLPNFAKLNCFNDNVLNIQGHSFELPWMLTNLIRLKWSFRTMCKANRVRDIGGVAENCDVIKLYFLIWNNHHFNSFLDSSLDYKKDLL